MTKTDTRDVRATVQQIWSLEAAGCEIVRCAVPVREAAEQLGEIKKSIRIPLVADIHFNYKLALIAIAQGVDGLRLNPGNIGARKYVEEVVKAASERKIPIRIGVNAGSLEKDLLQKYNGPTAEGMVESGLRHIRILEDVGYQEIKISLKASDPLMMIEAYRMLADKVDYPFHLGVTEAGTPGIGTIKSAVGLGTLLAEGIGDTIRVSLAADPVEEVRVGIEILKALKIRKEGMTFVACPSCGRADVDLVGLAKSGRRTNAALQQSEHPRGGDGLRSEWSRRSARRRSRCRRRQRHRSDLQKRRSDPQSAGSGDRRRAHGRSRKIRRRKNDRASAAAGRPDSSTSFRPFSLTNYLCVGAKLSYRHSKKMPADAEVVSHKLLVRAGFIRQISRGIYDYFPLALKVIRKIEAIVREEMNRAGAQELLMPISAPAELWQESGRWDTYGKELMRFKDRHERDFCLGPTHEEIVTDLVRRSVRSYRELPMNLYQIQTKFRDELAAAFWPDARARVHHERRLQLSYRHRRLPARIRQHVSDLQADFRPIAV